MPESSSGATVTAVAPGIKCSDPPAIRVWGAATEPTLSPPVAASVERSALVSKPGGTAPFAALTGRRPEFPRQQPEIHHLQRPRSPE